MSATETPAEPPMLERLFRRHAFLEEGLEEWCFEAWAWLMRNLGGVSRLAATPLVLPSPDYFPPTTTEGEARAAYLFERVKGFMGMSAWECDLQAVRRRTNDRLGEFWYVKSDATAAGTFQVRDNRVIISYAADLVQNPRALVPVLAHELSHYLLATVAEPPPGGALVHELLTELTVAYCGFGAFAANAAFSFEQHRDAFSEGWSAQRSGYFSERTWALAVALFLTLKGQPGAAKNALKPGIAAQTTKAERYLNRNPDLLAALRAIA